MHDVACVEEACKEPVHKIKKKRETAAGVEKSKENLCMWKNNIMH